MGSYFGGALCVLDLDSDGNTDFVVVGAPLYYQALPRREGRMYVYSLSEQVEYRPPPQLHCSQSLVDKVTSAGTGQPECDTSVPLGSSWLKMQGPHHLTDLSGKLSAKAHQAVERSGYRSVMCLGGPALALRTCPTPVWNLHQPAP